MYGCLRNTQVLNKTCWPLSTDCAKENEFWHPLCKMLLSSQNRAFVKGYFAKFLVRTLILPTLKSLAQTASTTGGCHRVCLASCLKIPHLLLQGGAVKISHSLGLGDLEKLGGGGEIAKPKLHPPSLAVSWPPWRSRHLTSRLICKDCAKPIPYL